MEVKKKLSLIHLERGIALLGEFEKEGTAAEMVAVYQAPAGTLVKARKDPAVMEGMIDIASEMDGTEATAVITDFFQQCGVYLNAIVASSPVISEEARAKIQKAQSVLNQKS